MRSTLKPLASHLQVIARGNVSHINHPCYLGYKGEVRYIFGEPTFNLYMTNIIREQIEVTIEHDDNFEANAETESIHQTQEEVEVKHDTAITEQVSGIDKINFFKR